MAGSYLGDRTIAAACEILVTARQNMNESVAFAGDGVWDIAGWTMLHFLWIGTLIGGLAVLGRIVFRRASANVRYATALVCLSLMTVAPVVIAVWLASNGAVSSPVEGSAVADTSVGVDVPQLMPSEEALAADVDSGAGEVIELATGGVDSLDEPVLAIDDQGKLSEQNEWAATSSGGVAVSEPSPGPSLRGKGDLVGAGLNDWDVWFLEVREYVPYLPWMWILGTPITFALLAAGVVGAKRLERASRMVGDSRIEGVLRGLMASMRIGRRVTVAICDRIASPVLVGVVRPMILLPPAALTGWSPDEIEMVLLHELAHVRRWDNLVNLVQRIVESLLFFHPAVWLVSAWVRRERELCCDEFVVAKTDRPHAYAELLVALAAQMPRSVLFHPAASSAMSAGPLKSRIRRILKLQDDPMLVSGKSLALTLGGLLVAATLAVLYLPMSGQAEQSAAKKSTTEDTESTEGNSVDPLFADVVASTEVQEANREFGSMPDEWPKGVVFPSPKEGEISKRAWELLGLKLVPMAKEDRQDPARKSAVKIVGGLSASPSKSGPYSLLSIGSYQATNFDQVAMALDSVSANYGYTLIKFIGWQGEDPVTMRLPATIQGNGFGKRKESTANNKDGDENVVQSQDLAKLAAVLEASKVKRSALDKAIRELDHSYLVATGQLDRMAEGGDGNVARQALDKEFHANRQSLEEQRAALDDELAGAWNAYTRRANELTTANSRFPSLEQQKLADLVWKSLGLEMEALDAKDLERVRKLGYDGGLKVVSGGAGWQGGDVVIRYDDLLVGLHVWPTTSMKDVATVLTRGDIQELNPLKFYVVRRGVKVNPDNPERPIEADVVVTGRAGVEPVKQPTQVIMPQPYQPGRPAAVTNAAPVVPYTPADNVRVYTDPVNAPAVSRYGGNDSAPLIELRPANLNVEFYYFYSPSSEPSRKMRPIAERVGRYVSGVEFKEINVDKAPELAKRFDIQRVPTVVVLREGKLLLRMEGSQSEEDLQANYLNALFESRKRGPGNEESPRAVESSSKENETPKGGQDRYTAPTSAKSIKANGAGVQPPSDEKSLLAPSPEPPDENRVVKSYAVPKELFQDVIGYLGAVGVHPNGNTPGRVMFQGTPAQHKAFQDLLDATEKWQSGLADWSEASRISLVKEDDGTEVLVWPLAGLKVAYGVVSSAMEPGHRGCSVREVTPGSPAAWQDIRPHDFITSVEGFGAKNIAELESIVRSLTEEAAGRRVRLNIRVKRFTDGKAQQLSKAITLPGEKQIEAIGESKPSKSNKLGSGSTATTDSKAPYVVPSRPAPQPMIDEGDDWGGQSWNQHEVPSTVPPVIQPSRPSVSSALPNRASSRSVPVVQNEPFAEPALAPNATVLPPAMPTLAPSPVVGSAMAPSDPIAALPAPAVVAERVPTVQPPFAAEATSPFDEPAPRSKSSLRYDGKGFIMWRDQWQNELSAAKRAEAVRALGAFARAGYGEEAVDAILEVAGNYDFLTISQDPEGKLKQAVLDELTPDTQGHELAKIWLPTLLERVKQDPKKWQWLVHHVLYRLRTDDPDIIAMIRSLAESGPPEIRMEALGALVRLSKSGSPDRAVSVDEETGRLLANALSDKNTETVSSALRLLLNYPYSYGGGGFGGGGGTVPPPKLIFQPQLVPLLFHAEEPIRQQAREVLQHIGEQDAPLVVETLVAVLEDKDDSRKKDHLNAILALAAMGKHGQKAVPELVNFLKESKDQEILVTGIVALGRSTGFSSVARAGGRVVLDEGMVASAAEKLGAQWAEAFEDKGLDLQEDLMERVFAEDRSIFPAADQVRVGGGGGFF